MAGPAAAGGKPAEVRRPPGPEPARDIALPVGESWVCLGRRGGTLWQGGGCGDTARPARSLQPTRAWAAPASLGTCALWAMMWASRSKPEMRVPWGRSDKLEGLAQTWGEK